MVIKGTTKEILNILENMTEEEFKAKLESNFACGCRSNNSIYYD